MFGGDNHAMMTALLFELVIVGVIVFIVRRVTKDRRCFDKQKQLSKPA